MLTRDQSATGVPQAIGRPLSRLRWPTVLIGVWIAVGVVALAASIAYINLANYMTVGCDTAQLHAPIQVADACWANHEHGYFLDMFMGGAAWCGGFFVLSLVWLMAWAHRMEVRRG